MSDPTCTARTRSGDPCPNRPLPGETLCFTHHPRHRERIQQASAEGGKNRRNTIRARRAIPADMRDVGAAVLQAIRDVETGKLAPGKAMAISSLARTYVAIHESSMVEARMDEIERKITERLQHESPYLEAAGRVRGGGAGSGDPADPGDRGPEPH